MPCGPACRAVIRVRLTQTRLSTGQTGTVIDVPYVDWNSWAQGSDCSNARGGGAFEWTWFQMPLGGRFIVSVNIPCNECGWAAPGPTIVGWRVECAIADPIACQAWLDDHQIVVESLTITRECDPYDPQGGGFVCRETTAAACAGMGGTFQGPGTACGYEECGSCCLEPVCQVGGLQLGPQCLDGYLPSVCAARGGYPCNPDGLEPNRNGVFSCTRDITQITITTSGHTFANAQPPGDAALAEQYMNSTYVVQLDCSGRGEAVFDMGGGWSVTASVEFVRGGEDLVLSLGVSKNGSKWCATSAFGRFQHLQPSSGCMTVYACDDGESPALFNVNSGVCGADNLRPLVPGYSWPLIGDAKYEWVFA